MDERICKALKMIAGGKSDFRPDEVSPEVLRELDSRRLIKILDEVYNTSGQGLQVDLVLVRMEDAGRVYLQENCGE